MTKETIDDFLSNKKDIAQKIKNIAEKYEIADFVKVTKSSKEYFKNNATSNVKQIYGCLYNERKDYLVLDVDSVEYRLTNQYMEFLRNILIAKEEIDKNFYIVAFHYLTLCKQLGYQLTIANDAPFCFIGEEMSPLAKENYRQYEEISSYRLYRFFPFFTEDDLVYYNTFYRECGYSHHATKHFSLIEYIVGFDNIVSKCKFNNRFEQMLDLFVFRYKAIYTTEQLSIYMYSDEKEKIKKSLVDIEIDR